MGDDPREPPNYKPPQSASELLKRYAAGERGFVYASLRNANLSGANLHGADLRNTNLIGATLNAATLIDAHLGRADLTAATLRDADLSRATLRDADLIDTTLIGATLIDANLREATLIGADLSDATLRGADLRGALLIGANLSGADLTGADLSGALLIGANLSGANLIGADLSGALLSSADLRRALLSRGDLRSALLRRALLSGENLSGENLSNALLRGVPLIGANLSGARIGYTVLADVDLAPLCETDPPVVHEAESRVDYKAIVRSLLTPCLEDFLVRTGMPAIFAQYNIECAKAVSGRIFDMMRSTFISYGSPDETFAKKLYESLHKNGVRVFLFSEHAEPGERLHRMMRKGVNEHDRVVLVCSRASLDRKGVMNEIEETLAREAREGGETFLIPIRLDEYVFNGWKPKQEDIAQAVRDRVVADFEGADTDPAKFDAALSKLLRALRVKPGPVDPSSGASGGP